MSELSAYTEDPIAQRVGFYDDIIDSGLSWFTNYQTHDTPENGLSTEVYIPGELQDAPFVDHIFDANPGTPGWVKYYQRQSRRDRLERLVSATGGPIEVFVHEDVSRRGDVPPQQLAASIGHMIMRAETHMIDVRVMEESAVRVSGMQQVGSFMLACTARRGSVIGWTHDAHVVVSPGSPEIAAMLDHRRLLQEFALSPEDSRTYLLEEIERLERQQ